MQKVFISHSSKDKRFVRKLKEDLNENDIHTWFDEDQLDIGDSLITKIENSLDESSHFLIILSPTSVNSDWVKLELNQAIKRAGEKFIKKIIPIQYRECETPNELKGLLYYDLSKENVQIVENKVDFITDGYPGFLNKLIRAIKSSSEMALTQADKNKFHDELVKNEKENSVRIELIATLVLQVVVYATTETRGRYIERIMAENYVTPNESEHIRPILLPKILKNIFKDIQMGQRLDFSSDFSERTGVGHFAGFRRDDTKVTLPSLLRKDLGILNGSTRVFRFDGNQYSIEISSENEND